MYIIKDWAGNIVYCISFGSFDEAEYFLANKLGDSYDTDREEYYIEEIGE